MGCRVTSAAFSEFRQKSMKVGSVARTARYSGRYRPAWRMNQTGGRSALWPSRTERSLGFWDVLMSGLKSRQARGLKPVSPRRPSSLLPSFFKKILRKIVGDGEQVPNGENPFATL